jgi:hypothetical protein
LMSKGYGSFAYPPPRGHTELAHRVAWFLTYGEWPPLWALHSCDVRRCVRPSHLFNGDNQANMDDMWAKGRGILPTRQPTLAERARGERQGSAVLTDDSVRELREHYATGLVSQEELALLFGLSQTQVSRVLRRESWTHVH